MQIFYGNIPVRVNPFFWLLIILIGWVNTFTIPGTIVWMGVVFFSVLVHEFGHAMTARYFGQRAEIELFALGGVTRRQGPPLRLWQEFLIVLNGPLAGFALFFLALLALKSIGNRPVNLFIYAIHVVVYVNLFWTIVNLLPIQPLDGGHLLRIILEGIFGFRGVKIAFFVSTILSGVASLIFIGTGLFLIGALFFLFTFESYRSWREILSLTDQDQNIAMQRRLKAAEGEMKAGNYNKALEQLNLIREETKKGIIFIAATELMAQLYCKEGEHKAAYDLLQPHAHRLSSQGLLLLHKITFSIGNWKEAISLGNRTFQAFPNYETAVINALCHATLGQVQPALGWLQTAVNEGIPNLEEVLNRKEFDYIRNTPEFQRFQDIDKRIDPKSES